MAHSHFWQNFARNHMAVIGALMLVVALVVAVFAPWLAPYDPKEVVRVWWRQR
jgi:ABC-type antimicrobial peptide transport system permease subunit